MILETNRLILRPWEESDAENLFKYASHPDVGPIAGWAVHTSVEKKASNIGLPYSEGEIGYWIGVPYWGQGLIPEAVRELMRYGFENLKLNRIWCGYFDGNEKSKRVQEKCGFHYHHTTHNVPCAIEGVFRTEHITCLSKEEWQSVR